MSSFAQENLAAYVRYVKRAVESRDRSREFHIPGSDRPVPMDVIRSRRNDMRFWARLAVWYCGGIRGPVRKLIGT